MVNATTAAQYFHLLRRQMRRPFRKPLIVASPKKLLKNKEATSNLEDFGEGLRFRRVIYDANPNLVAPEKVRKVLLCSGQVNLDLQTAREAARKNASDGKSDIVIMRVEQLCPFPFSSLIPELQRFKNAEVTWVQEEPKNQGPYYFVKPRLENILRHLKRPANVSYAGRDPSASTSTGYTV